MIDVPGLVPALAQWMPRQRWYSGQVEPESLTVLDQEIRGDRFPVLVRLLLEADERIYQVVVGVRSRDEHPEFLRGQDQAFIADVSTHQGDAIAYDAVYDPELALVILDAVAPHEKVERARLMGAEQSNSSIVYDERLILKVFRRIQRGHNPEVEITEGLAGQGFHCVAEPLATLRVRDFDLAILQPFLAGAVEGWALALTSLRDLFGLNDTSSIPIINLDDPPPGPPDPGQAGGDFAGEATRLGEMTGAMHVALAEAFGRRPADGGEWAMAIAKQVDELEPGDVDREGAQAILEELGALDAGAAIRVHGDYHLGQVLRTDAGWFVLDFEGEPGRPIDDRRRPSSPLKDVAGMLRSFHYASAVARTERDEDALEDLAASWEMRNRQAFLRGYMRAAGDGGILPADPESIATVLAAFELEKAVYELGYERAHRPDWIHIPLAALRRLTERET
ncbi:MAG TPA: phosphotransferase [Acidimicrobiales bacterium]|nr:phosphotransferase [Acidimicrobiales bacterium]